MFPYIAPSALNLSNGISDLTSATKVGSSQTGFKGPSATGYHLDPADREKFLSGLKSRADPFDFLFAKSAAAEYFKKYPSAGGSVPVPSGPSAGGSVPSGPSGPSAGVPVPSGPSAAALDYYNADISKLYGMDKNVAFQEALANTAYQRAVKDMQSAGLNPASLFGAGRAATADGVGYVASSGGSSGGRSSAAGAAARSEYGMSKSDYTQLTGVCTVLGMAAGAAAGYFIPGLSISSGATLGAMAGQGFSKIISQW